MAVYTNVMKMQDITPGRQGFSPNKSELHDWLNKQILCVIATNGDDGYPNAATVAFSQTEDLEFIIITDESSRKSLNIKRDSRVALTITNENDRYTVQLQGEARQLSWEEFGTYESIHYAKLPYSLPFKDIAGQAPFLIKPRRIRFSDVSIRPWLTTDVA